MRTTDESVTWAVGRLPNLKRLLLPYHLTIDPLNATQFTLQGENAGVIDAVVLQGGTGNTTTQLPVAKGLDFALVILPSGSGSSSPNSSTGNDTSNSSGAGTTNETSITVDATKDNTGHVQMTTKNSSTPAPAKPAAKPGATPSKTDDTTSPPKALPAGTYAVTPFIQIGTELPDPAAVKAAKQAVTDATNALAAAKGAQAKKDAVTKATTDLANAKAAAQKAAATKPPDQAAIASANKALADATQKLAAATAAAKDAPVDDVATATTTLATAKANEKAAAQPTVIYMPLPITDMKGKPLTFTIPEAKKPAPRRQRAALRGPRLAQSLVW